MKFGVLGPIAINGSVPGAQLERRLLTALLIHRGVTVSEGALCEALWADAQPASARNSLQSKVSRLRSVIGADRLARVNNGYLLSVDPLECDADEFVDLVASCDGARPEIRLRTLRAALDLWRGNALSEFAHDEFARAAAASLELQRNEAQESLDEARLELGKCAEVIASSEQLIAAEPFRESRWSLRIRALALDGQTVDALRCVRDARRHFAEEAGLDLSASLLSLEQRILAGELGAAPDAAQPTSPARQPTVTDVGPRHGDRASTPEQVIESAANATRTTVALGVPRMVQRESARAAIAALVESCLAGEQRTTWVVGDAGLGKSRLLTAGAALARSQGLRVLTGRTSSGVRTPFGPVGVLAAALAEADGADSLMAPPSPDDSAGAVWISRLARAVAAQPTLLVFDDAHLMDSEATSALDTLLAELETLSSVGTAPVSVLFAHRPLRPTAQASDLHRLRRLPGATTVRLAALDEAGVAAMVAAATGVRPSGTTVHALTSATRGNPRSVSEHLEQAVDSGNTFMRAGLLECNVEPNLVGSADAHSMFERGWERLTPDQRRCLGALAISRTLDVLTLTSTAEVVAKAVGQTPVDVLEAIAAGLREHVLTDESNPTFPSESIRHECARRLPTSEASQLVDDLIDAVIAFAARPGERAQAAPLVTQLLLAAELFATDVEPALIGRWALAAAEECRSRGAWASAAAHLQTVIERADPDRNVRLADGSAIDVALGIAMFRAHDEYRAQVLLDDAASRARRRGDAESEGAALTAVHRIAICYPGAVDLAVPMDVASARLHEFIDTNSASAPVAAATACAVLCEQHAVSGELETADRLARKALSLTDGPPADVEFAAGLTALFSLDLARARRHLLRCCEQSDDDPLWVRAWALGRLALLQLLEGDDAECQATATRAATLQHDRRLLGELALTRAVQTALAARRNDPAMHDFADKAEALATRTGYRFGLAISLPASASALLAAGNERGAFEQLDRFHSLLGGKPWPFVALAHLHLGDASAAADLVQPRSHRLPDVPSLLTLPAIAAAHATALALGDDVVLGTTRPLLTWLTERGVRCVPGWPVLDLGDLPLTPDDATVLEAPALTATTLSAAALTTTTRR